MICENLQSAEDVVSTLGTLSKPCPDCGHHVLAHRFTTKVCDACIAFAQFQPSNRPARARRPDEVAG